MSSNISYWPAGLNIYFLGVSSVSSYQSKGLNNKMYSVHSRKVHNNIFRMFALLLKRANKQTHHWQYFFYWWSFYPICYQLFVLKNFIKIYVHAALHCQLLNGQIPMDFNTLFPLVTKVLQ